jgi:hypothetical protein
VARGESYPRPPSGWLSANNATVTAVLRLVLRLVLGSVLLGKGLGGLFGEDGRT